MSAALAYHSGMAAEQGVADHYRAEGYLVRNRRWRRRGGELDLVVSDGKTIVFVEVKKSRSMDQAAGHLSRAQKGRLEDCARVYLGQLPAGQDTDCRFDLALVDGQGRIEVHPNAFV